MTETTIPSWLDVECEVLDGAPLNPLEKFILAHEPDDETGSQWRRDLSAVIEWVKQ